jgi:hypothetical protein
MFHSPCIKSDACCKVDASRNASGGDSGVRHVRCARVGRHRCLPQRASRVKLGAEVSGSSVGATVDLAGHRATGGAGVVGVG